MTYRDYEISFNIYGNNEYSVQCCGDDIIVPTLQDAKDFIDGLYWERDFEKMAWIVNMD